MIKVTVWNEGVHEKTSNEVAGVYPAGIHGCIKNFLSTQEDMTVTTATLAQRRCGLSDEVLDNTDVLIWWGHMAHAKVPDEVVDRVQAHIQRGMGLIALHSAHYSKIFKRMMGTTCSLKWRDGARERIWTIMPNHPIAEGVDETFVLEPEEMYGEMFDIPTPDEIVFLGWFNGGEVFRSGCTFTRGHGRIFYFQPGHESNPSFKNENVQKIIRNAVKWACPVRKNIEITCPHFMALEK